MLVTTLGRRIGSRTTLPQWTAATHASSADIADGASRSSRMSSTEEYGFELKRRTPLLSSLLRTTLARTSGALRSQRADFPNLLIWLYLTRRCWRRSRRWTGRLRRLRSSVCNVVSMLPRSRGDSVHREMTQNPHHFQTRVVFAGAGPRRPCNDGWDARNAPAAKNSRLISGIGGPLVCPPSLPKFTAVVGASAREICSGSLKLIRERVPAVN